MLTVERIETGFRVTDRGKQTAAITGEVVPAEEGPSLSRAVDDIVYTNARRLECPPGLIVVEDLHTEESHSLGQDIGPLELSNSSYSIQLNAPVLCYLRFDGPADVRKPDHQAVVIEFLTETSVTLGFRSRIKSPRSEIRVPRSTEGVATALTALSGTPRTESPDRSFPTMRKHPPTLSFVDDDGDRHVPPEYRESDSDVQLVVPPALPYLLTGATLAYYSGAEVTVEPGATPTLQTGERHELPSMPEFSTEANRLLRRTFYLDCLVRNVGPHGTDLAEADVLDELPIDANRLYEQPLSERIDSYLQIPYDEIEDDLPEWNLSMYVDPSFDAVPVLPYVLYNVPQLQLPHAQPLEDDKWLSSSVGDSYRAPRESVSVDLLQPSLADGQAHGWLSDGVPIDVFKPTLSAYENRLEYRSRESDEISIVAIVNDSDMGIEASDAAEIYRDRASDVDIDMNVTVREQLSTNELASVFAASHDMVHYVGHCEPDGLVCRDGNLSASDLTESNAETFFLNACGSYYEGMQLIEKGSVAGGVTFNRVLDNNAALVGVAFARLLAHGFSIERSISLARRRVMVGKNYGVVGDGTHTLMQAEEILNDHLKVERSDDDEFHVSVHASKVFSHGGYYQSYLQTDDRSHLYGSVQKFTVSRSRLKTFLGYGTTPVVYDNDLRWSDTLRSEL